MKEYFEKKMQQAEQGKKIFNRIFDLDELDISDAWILVLTDNEDCIRCGIKYLPDFIKTYHKRAVHVLLDNVRYAELFLKAGGKVIACETDELQKLAIYLNVFHEKDSYDSRIVFLTEKNGYGLAIEELIEKRVFSIEEYVAISLYQLCITKEWKKFGIGCN